MMRGRIVLGFVDAKHDCDVFVFRRSRDDYFPDGAPEMFLCILSFREPARRFDHDLRAHRLPRNRRRVALREYPEFFALNLDSVFRRRNIMMKIAQHRIVFQEVRQRLCISDVVDRDEIDILVTERRTKNIAPNATEPVDPHFNCHALPPSSFDSRMITLQPRQLARMQLKTVDPWKKWQDNARLAALSSAQFAKLFETACGRMT